MTQTLTSLIDWLKRTNVIKSRPDLIATLISIDKLTNNDIDKAYFLGHFFKFKFDSDNLMPADRKYLINFIKINKLDNYFYLKTKPEKDIIDILVYLFAILGAFLIVSETKQLINGNFWTGIVVRSSYGGLVIKDHGYFVISGLICLVGGLIRIRHDIKRTSLLKSISN